MLQPNHHSPTSITTDKAGRLVFPKPIRNRFNLVSGKELEVELEPDGMRLLVLGGGDSLRRTQGIVVYHGSRLVQLDVAEFIRGERESRTLHVAAPGTIKHSS